MNTLQEIQSIKDQLVQLFSPSAIFLFGSQAKYTAKSGSDIDICLIKNTNDKRQLLIQAYIEVESSKPFDLIIYTEDEWKIASIEKTSFASIIKEKGTLLYGRQ